MDKCSICGKPIEEGQGIYSVTGNHYTCTYPDGYKSPMEILVEAEKGLNKALVALGMKPVKRSKKPEGKGPGAQKIAQWLATYFSEHFQDIQARDIHFWLQEGSYRGPKWDLACWGGWFDHPDSDNLKVNFHSWATMGQILKSGGIDVTKDGILEFDIGPKRPASALLARMPQVYRIRGPK